MNPYQQGPNQPIELVKELREDGVFLQMRVPENLRFFEGHFDAVPVVAGVVQLNWVVSLIHHHLGHQVWLDGMQAVKFHQLLFPNDIFDLVIKRARGKWHFQITSNDRKIASGRILDANFDQANAESVS